MRSLNGGIEWNGCHIGRTIALALLIGLAIRLILAPFTTSPFDVSAGWAAVIQEIYAGNSLYDAELYKYTPIWGYILSVIAYVADLLGMTSFGEMFTVIYPGMELTYGYGFITNFEFNVLLKTPSMIFDVLAAFAFYRLVMDITGDRRKSEIAFMLWFLCPLVIASSSVLCMFDSIMIYFMVESLIFFRRRNMLLAGVFIMLSVLTKVFSCLLIPLMVVYIISERDLAVGTRMKNLAMAAVGGLSAFLAVYILPMMSGEFADSLWFLTSRSDTYAAGGFSVTSISFNNIFFYVPAIVAILVLSCVAMYMSKDDRDRRFLILTAVVSAVMFCFPFVSYTPQYGMVLMLPVVLLYVLDGRIAYIPWILTTVFLIHGITYYWEALLFPIAAFTDLMDITEVVTNMGNGTVYYIFQLLMSAAGFVIMMILLFRHVVPFIRDHCRRRAVADGNRCEDARCDRGHRGVRRRDDGRSVDDLCDQSVSLRHRRPEERRLGRCHGRYQLFPGVRDQLPPYRQHARCGVLCGLL